MNTIEPIFLTSPYGKSEECANFVIDTPTSLFVLSGIASVGQTYTFSAWIKSESPAGLIVGGARFSSSTDWLKHSVTFKAETEDVTLTFDAVGTYYIYHPQLEIGNKASDWTPAPEDVDQSIIDATDEVRQSITDQSASITTTCEGIILEALASYTQTGDFESFKETVNAQLQLLSDQLTLKFTETSQRIEEANTSLQDQLNTITTYFTFDIDGMTIGKVDNPKKISIDNDEINIIVNGVAVQTFDADGNALMPSAKVTKSLNLLGYLIAEDENGNVNCDYVGGE